ncbi:MAG: FAD-dependent oxidoreductase [Armatimonadetes bacterium]|nr:FAD-dependent oxidoreductase [Armatimonadota bacterium]
MTGRVDETQTFDVVVVGGGLAAVCAAVQAGRLGCRTVLLEKDPVLGGNAGPLLGVHPSGAHSFHPYASELGVIGEIIEEAAWQRAKIRTAGLHYNISQQFEMVLKQTLDDAGVTVYRRTYGRDAETAELPDGRQRITAVIAEDMARFRTVRFEVGTGVIDGSGDGHVAMRAGARFRKGREARSETGERSAVEVADSVTLGTSLTALVRKCREPVEFIAPPGTLPFEPGYGCSRAAFELRNCLRAHSSWDPDYEFCFLWHTETGGQLDTIDDDHAIHEELLRQLYSAWAHIKSAHAEESAHWELTWVSPKAGKRESRRFVGDHVLTQTEVERGEPFPDAVCYGGYSVDIHNPAGERNTQVEIVFYSIPPLWSMPYRSLYSAGVANLWLAGRLASVTHLGLGSWRLMRTLSGGGQAVGVAAALAKREGTCNRGIHRHHLAALQQTILREDGGAPHLRNDDPDDLARQAVASATSECRHGVEEPDDWLPLDRPRGVQLWDWCPRLDSVELYLRNETGEPVELDLCVAQHVPEHPWREEHSRRGFAYEKVGNRMEWGDDNRVAAFAPAGDGRAVVPAGCDGWVRFDLDLDLAPPDPNSDDPRVNLVLPAAAGISWVCSRRRYDFARRLQLDRPDEYTGDGDSHLFRIAPAPPYGEAANVINGIHRRWSTNPLNAWQADPADPRPALTLAWPEPVELGSVQLTFDTLTRAYREMPFDSEQRASPMCVADYRVEVQALDGSWREVAVVRDNYHRRRVHAFEPSHAAALRVTVERVWDPAYAARLYEVRAYRPSRPCT